MRRVKIYIIIFISIVAAFWGRSSIKTNAEVVKSSTHSNIEGQENCYREDNNKRGEVYPTDSQQICNEPIVIFRLNENESGSAISQRRLPGITTVKCYLSDNVGGIRENHQIYIKWNGDNQISALSAEKLYISNDDFLHPQRFYSSGFKFNCGSTCAGYHPIGTCYIPQNIKAVHISSKFLQAAFNNRDYWIRLGELNGTYKL